MQKQSETASRGAAPLSFGPASSGASPLVLETFEEGHRETGAHLEGFSWEGEEIGKDSNEEWLRMLRLLPLEREILETHQCCVLTFRELSCG